MIEPTIDVRTTQLAGGKAAILSVDNQAKLNVVGRKLVKQFSAAVDRLAVDGSIRALVVRGEGNRAFIGGADIREMAEFDQAAARVFITDLHGMCKRLRDFPVPTLARIDGYCLGAGMEVAASCDLRAASADAKFGMPEVRVGIPSVIEAALLPHLLGWGRARELLLTGDIFDAEAAHAMGFVQRLVPGPELDDAIDGWLSSILSAGPRAIRSQKELFRDWERAGLEQSIEAGIDAFAEAYCTDEPNRRMRAFLQAKGSLPRD